MNCSLSSIIHAEINVFSHNALGCSFTYFSYPWHLGSPWVRLWRLVLACLSKLRLASAPNTSLHIARGALWWPVQQAHRGLHQGHLVAVTAVHIYTPRDRAVHEVTFSLNLLFTCKQAQRQPAGPLAVRAKVVAGGRYRPCCTATSLILVPMHGRFQLPTHLPHLCLTQAYT